VNDGLGGPRPARHTRHNVDELREAIDGLAPIVGPALTSRLVAAVAQDGPAQLTAREALSVLTAQLAVLSNVGPVARS
jgi:hypothetical protein